MRIGFAVTALAVAYSVLGAAPASANVATKNGNFFIGYTDIVYPGGFEPKIERVYNSKTPYNGMFGWGWGNEYEVFLTVSADGSVVVNEYGGGAQNRFTPVAFNQKELDDAVKRLVAVAQSVGVAGTGDQLARYERRLRTEATFRNDEWEKFVAQKKIQPRQLANGAQLVSNKFSYQYVTRVQGGYVRTFDNGRVERFDDNGKLARIQDKNGNSITLSYSKDGKLEKLVDNFNRKMFFTFNGIGKVAKIQGENGKEANYQYNPIGELISSKDVDGNAYTFKYSGDKRHNLVEIGYSDKTTMKIAYYDREKFENVRQVTERDGTVTDYGYEYDKGGKGNTHVSVAVKSADGKPISSSKYEYVSKYKADGEEWTYKMVSVLDGERTETIYNECCGLPLIIKRGSEETTFQYDAKGHVTKKSTPTEVTDLAYDPKVGKVTKVTRYSKADKRKAIWSEFKYDAKGNLVFAKNSDKKGVQLFYDPNGRIASLVDQNKRRINFKYNESSKPVEITDPQLGTITVSYTNSGEIKKVESSAGRKIALQVTSAFQNLLDIIRPAGVSLAF